jgi:hypothetical protein
MRTPALHPGRSGSRSLAPLLLVLLGSLGCGACHQIASTHLGTVGKAGGTLHSDDCGFTLVIPPDALPQDVPFVLQTEANPTLPATPGRTRVSKVCSVQPVIPLGKPSKVTLDFDAAAIPKSVSLEDVDLRLAPSEQRQVRLQGLAVDVAAKRVSATTTATGFFFATSPPGPLVAQIVISPAGPLALTIGQTQALTATVTNDVGQPDPTPVVWSVDLSRVARVDSSGVLTALAPGKATVTATAGEQTQTVELFVLSNQPSPATFRWENPLPQGNDIHGLSFAGPSLVVAAANGTVLVQQGDGGFTRLTTSRGVTLAGAAVGGGRAGAAGNLDVVQQGVELVSGVLLPLEVGALPQRVPASDLAPRSVFGDDAGVIAVGAGNDAFLLRAGDPTDAGWVPLQTPVSEALLTVDRDPARGRRVLGARGQVYRQQDQAWFPIWDQPLPTRFELGALLGHEAFGIDAASNLQRFVEGTGWSSDVAPPLALDHADLLGRLGDALVLAGADRQLAPHAWTRTGAAWTELTGLEPRDALYASAARDVADGGYLAGKDGAIYRVIGGTLTPLRTGSSEDISAIAVGPDRSAFAVTRDGCGDAFCRARVGHLLRRDADGSWKAIDPFVSPVDLNAVAVRSLGDVFLAGDQGHVFHFDGTSVTALQVPSSAAVRALTVCGGDVFLAGDQGLFAKFDGAQSFVPITSALQTSLRALACTGPTDVWAAADYAVLRYDGTTLSEESTGAVNNQPWRAIVVSSDEVWVTGETSYLLHGDRVSGGFTAVQEPAGLRLHGGYGLWQSGPGDLYLVGSQQRPRQAVLLRSDGAQWFALDAATDHELSAIAGSGPGDFFIAGRGGAILHAASAP